MIYYNIWIIGTLFSLELFTSKYMYSFILYLEIYILSAGWLWNLHYGLDEDWELVWNEIEKINDTY